VHEEVTEFPSIVCRGSPVFLPALPQKEVYTLLI
jgi:hypothetical protein